MSTSTAFAGLWSLLPTPLTPWVLDVIQSQGYSQMTPVQASTIPLFMKHKDVVVEAVTGSGKTLAFVLPTLEKLIRRDTRHRRNEIGALIISPTRELATQIHAVFSLFLSSQPNQSTSCDGEDPPLAESYPPPLLLVSSDQSSPAQDIQRFISTGADIVIGTPGRVEEFLLGKGRTSVNVKELEVLILDEADRLLDLGFQVAVTRIIMHLPKQRRTGLFSATMTDADAISELVRVGLRNPARVIVKVQAKKLKTKMAAASDPSIGAVVEERRTPANLQNYFVSCRSSEKLVQMIRIITHEISHDQSSHFIIYFATCACVDYFYRILSKFLPPSATLHSLHGNLSPSARTRTLSAFSSAIPAPSSPAILLATDVAARGLDIPSVNVVIQFDAPTDPKAFSHRCGRTARAGRSGRAWVLLSGRETEYVDFLRIRKIPLQERPYLEDPDGDASTIDDVSRQQDPAADRCLREIRDFVLTDRAIHDQAIKAYVSFVRAYSKHEASYIFRVKDLDLIGVAKVFGLLRLPKMPELKTLNRDSWRDEDIDWSSYAYSDKAQEAKRLAAMQDTAAFAAERDKKRTERSQAKKLNVAWSAKTGKSEERLKRREKKVKRREWEKAQVQSTVAATSTASKRTREDDSGGEELADDWAEMAREERMAKRVRKGEVAQTLFDAEFADLDM